MQDASGALSKKEVMAALEDNGTRVTKAQLDAFMAEVDQDQDGQLSLEEFVKFAQSDKAEGMACHVTHHAAHFTPPRDCSHVHV